MMTRITIPVTVEEREALRRLAHQELRDPREQARHILRSVLFGGGVANVDRLSVREPGPAAVEPISSP